MEPKTGIAVALQRISISLQGLKIDATYENMNTMMGCLQELSRIQEEVMALNIVPDEAEATEEKKEAAGDA